MINLSSFGKVKQIEFKSQQLKLQQCHFTACLKCSVFKKLKLIKNISQSCIAFNLTRTLYELQYLFDQKTNKMVCLILLCLLTNLQIFHFIIKKSSCKPNMKSCFELEHKNELELNYITSAYT